MSIEFVPMNQLVAFKTAKGPVNMWLKSVTRINPFMYEVALADEQRTFDYIINVNSVEQFAKRAVALAKKYRAKVERAAQRAAANAERRKVRDEVLARKREAKAMRDARIKKMG